MHQRLQEVLAFNFACADAIAEGEIVEITGDLTEAVPTVAGSLKVIGTVVRKRGHAMSNAGNVYGATPSVVTGGAPAECTVETRFRERRDDRVSGASVPVGPFVFDGNGAVIAYNASVHSPAAIRGLVITHAAAGGAVVQTLEY